ncbi:MAG: hypothetical protein JST46_17750 [Bacteroidetes bacterium]|nr:hypothetical protein [Bacteroidota bacterium]
MRNAVHKIRIAAIASLLLVLSCLLGYGQTHKYYFEKGILTASQIGDGKFMLTVDTKGGAQKMIFKFKSKEGDIFVYDLIKIDEKTLSEYQRSISYLKTRNKFSDLCIGKGGDIFLKVLEESEITSLGK